MDNTREELFHYFHQLVKPLKHYFQEDTGRIILGTSAAHYSREQAEMEGFLRPLWALGPLFGKCYLSEEFEQYKRSILASVMPDNPAYWGILHDYDQMIVEMASLAVMLIETKNLYWDQLTTSEQKQIFTWMDQVNQVKLHDNNWRFFRILVNAAFCKLGLPCDWDKLTEDKQIIENCYLGNGWYCDGTPQQIDYYIPWAFHYYGLLYAHYMEEEDPEAVTQYRKRSQLFAQSFCHWFDDTGAAVPFGRSLTYRFAQAAFWSVCVFTNTEVLPWGQLKQLISSHFAYWRRQSIQLGDGTLSIGYAYENSFMSEAYNSPGSPYWCFKAFILLASDPNHPFWQAEAIPIAHPSQLLIPEAKLLLANQDQGQHVLLYPANQFSTQLHGCDKYAKLVYSSRFGFSIPRGNTGLQQGAYDNCLAVAEKGTDRYVSKGRAQHVEVCETYTYQQWQPLPGVEVATYVVPLGAWHIRVHQITTERGLVVSDGGFSNQTSSSHPQDYQIDTLEHGCSFSSALGVTATIAITGYETVEAVFPSPNTNVLFPHSLFLAAKAELAKGSHVLVSGHYGGNGTPAAYPQVIVEKHDFVITYEKKCIRIPDKY